MVVRTGSAPIPCSDLVAFVGDDGLHSTPTQLSADHTGRVGAVGDHRVGASAGPAAPEPGHVNLGEHLGEHRAVVALSAGDDHRQRAPVPIDRLMDLHGQSAPGTPDAVSGWFNLVPGQILVIRSRPPVSGSGRVVFVAC